jgi:hypothetical protein
MLSAVAFVPDAKMRDFWHHGDPGNFLSEALRAALVRRAMDGLISLEDALR